MFSGPPPALYILPAATSMFWIARAYEIDQVLYPEEVRESASRRRRPSWAFEAGRRW